jgi:hypothetical protein
MIREQDVKEPRVLTDEELRQLREIANAMLGPELPEDGK